jgi:hypothetical protein
MFCISELVHIYIYVFSFGDKLQVLLYTPLSNKDVECFFCGDEPNFKKYLGEFDPTIVVSTSNLFDTIQLFLLLISCIFKIPNSNTLFGGSFSSSSFRVSLHVRGGSMLASRPGGLLSRQVLHGFSHFLPLNGRIPA